MLLHRETPLTYPALTLCATATRASFPILQNTVSLLPQSFAHGDAASPDLVNFFLHTQQRSIHPFYHLTDPCTHVPYIVQLHSLSCGYRFIFCLQPTTITLTSRIRVLERRNYLCVCFSLYCYQLTYLAGKQ